MAKAPISSKFAKFAAKTTKGKFDEARKAESRATGCPLPVGAQGLSFIKEIRCEETPVKPDGTGGIPVVSLILEVESPDEFAGKTLRGAGLSWFIRETANRTEEEAWQNMLDGLEKAGLPRSIREGYADWAEVVEWFIEEPRQVEFTVLKDDFPGNQTGKQIRFSEYVPESEVATAATPRQKEEPADDPEATYCTYLGKKHQVVSYDTEEDTYNLVMVATGRSRTDVPADKVTLL